MVDPFDANEKARAQLKTASVGWHGPNFLTVNESGQIGISIGDSEDLTRRINDLLPQTDQTSMGTIQAGPNMRATLQASPDDAEITPSESVDQSTANNIELVWTWIVTPKKPTGSLLLNAHIEVPVSGSDTIFTTDRAFRIPVHGTIGYYAGQVFVNWATWAALATATAGGATWFYKRLKRPSAPATPNSHPAGGTEPAPPASNRT